MSVQETISDNIRIYIILPNYHNNRDKHALDVSHFI